jgi:angiopoietin 2/serine protease 12 (motopsin)
VPQLSHIFIFLVNSYLSQLTGSDSYKIRVILTDTEDQSKYADYSHFKVNGPDFKYSLDISGYSRTAGNYLHCIM